MVYDDEPRRGTHLPIWSTDRMETSTDDGDERRERFPTRQEAIDQAIAPAIAEGDYDLMAICYEAFDWKIDHDADGNELLNTAGFEQTVSEQEFWEIVAKHEIKREPA